MKPPVIVVGYRGNMGKRYTKILDHLDYPWFGIEDMGTHYDRQRDEYVSTLDTNPYHSVIICTPTHTHMKLIRRYKTLNLPILCEKPISFDPDDVQDLINNKVNISMVNQYKSLSGKGGATYYNFYNSGGDGVEWDCINIIGLAGQEKAYISNDSLVWECCINGNKLELNDVNKAYVEMIRDWLENQEPDYNYLMEAHKRSKEGYYEKGTYSNSGKVNKHEAARENPDDATRKKDSSAESAGSVPKKRSPHKRQKQGHTSAGSTANA